MLAFDPRKRLVHPSTALPVLLLTGYMAIFALVAVKTGNNASFAPELGLDLSTDTATLVSSRLALALWGVSLVVFASVAMVIIGYAGHYVIEQFLPDDYSSTQKTVIGVMTAMLVIFALYLFLDDRQLSGGLPQYLYALAGAGSTEMTKAQILGLMNLVTTVTFAPALALTLALATLCNEARTGQSDHSDCHGQRFQVLLVLTATFLCVGIIQIYLQYQWLTALMEDRDLATRITSLMTLAMSGFYTGLLLILFIPTAHVVQTLTGEQRESDDGHGVILGNNVLQKARTAALLLSPLLTALVAELPVHLFNQPG